MWLGAGLVQRVSPDVLRPVLAAMLLAAALAVLKKGGVDVPLGLLLGLPPALAALFAVVSRRVAVSQSRSRRTSA